MMVMKYKDHNAGVICANMTNDENDDNKVHLLRQQKIKL